MVFSLGSVTDYILNSINPFPANISGTLATSVNKAINVVNNKINSNLGTTNIADTYFPAISNLALAETIRLMAIQDNGVQSVSVGEMNVNNSNLKEMAKYYEEEGKLELANLTRGVKFFKARG